VNIKISVEGIAKLLIYKRMDVSGCAYPMR